MANQYKRNNEKKDVRNITEKSSKKEKKRLSTQDAKSDLNDWTLIIYHSGETALSEELIWSLKEIARVGTPDKVELIALMDSISPDLWEFSVPRNTAKSNAQSVSLTIEALAGNIFHNERLGPPVIRPSKKEKPFKSSNLASARFLRDFVVETIENHPAKHYMLILSGHGDGMIGETLLVDRGAERFLSVPKLNWVLQEITETIGKQAKKFQPNETKLDSRLDILGFDACGMLTAEVSHLLAEEVKYIVGSEGIMNKAGWPHHLILDYLKQQYSQKEPKIKPEDLAVATVKNCVNYYADFRRVGMSIDMAVVKTDPPRKTNSPWNKLVTKIKDLVKHLSNNLNNRQITNAVITAHWYAQSYGAEYYVDLSDFCQQLKLAAPELTDLCDAVNKALDKVVIHSCYSGGEFQHSHGLSLYFPWCATDRNLRRYTRYYNRDENKVIKTPFNEATGWGEFLWDFIYATRRKPRTGNEELIFMPLPGYRDHLSDFNADAHGQDDHIFTTSPSEAIRAYGLYAKSDKFKSETTIAADGKRVDPDPKRVDPDPKRVDPDPKSGAGSTFKFKNPSMVFRENLCKDSTKPKKKM